MFSPFRYDPSVSTVAFHFYSFCRRARNMLTNYEVGCVREPVIPGGILRNIGTVLDVGDADVTVTGIGRMWYPGNVDHMS